MKSYTLYYYICNDALATKLIKQSAYNVINQYGKTTHYHVYTFEGMLLLPQLVFIVVVVAWPGGLTKVEPHHCVTRTL